MGIPLQVRHKSTRVLALGLKRLAAKSNTGGEQRTTRGRVKKVEFWRWRYRSVSTGRMCKILLPMTAEEAAKYPDAQRIEGTMILLEREEEDFDETTPDVYPKETKQ
jgi:hypothetical protein